MSKYEVQSFGRNAKIVDEKGGLVALVETSLLAEYMAGILKQETAPLLETIATTQLALEAASERIKALEYTLRLIANSASSELIQSMAKTALGEAKQAPSEDAPNTIRYEDVMTLDPYDIVESLQRGWDGHLQPHEDTATNRAFVESVRKHLSEKTSEESKSE